jgi:P4 family phage/plasmid primase-like protien
MKNTTRDFINLLLRGTMRDLWICSLPNDKGAGGARHVRTRDLEQILEFCKTRDVKGYATYYCVSSISGASRNLETVAETPILWFDLDYKDVACTPEQALARVRQLPMPPTRLHATGHGLHGIYVLKRPFAGDNISKVLRQLADVVGGDVKVCHAAALLRMPGTHNSKDGEWTPVRSLRTPGRVYHYTDIEKWLQTQQPVIARRNAPAPNTDPFKRHAQSVGFAAPIDAEARLRAMQHKAPGDAAVHQTQLQVTASLLQAGLGVDEVVERVLEATQEAVEGRPDWDWDREARVIQGMCTSWLKKHPPKPEKKRKPPPKRPDIEKPIILAEASGIATSGVATDASSDADEGILADTRDDPEPAGAQVVSLAVARAERDLKKGKAKNTHVVLARGFLDALRERGEQILYEGGRAHRYWNREAVMAMNEHDVETRRAWAKMWQRILDEPEREWLNAEIQSGCDALELTSRNSLVSEVRGLLRRQLHRDYVPWDQHGGVATRSGLFNPDTMEIRPLKPEDYATHRVECDYDPKAKCPLWLQFLADCLPNKKTIEIVQEFFGAALIERKPREMTRAMVLFAPPNTGKSNLLNVFAGLLSDSPNTTPFDALENAHGTVDFLRPAPWVLHEAFDQSKWHFSAIAKALLSGDDVQVNVKNGPLVTHKFRQAIAWGTNFPPQFKDTSDAMRHRLMIIKLHHTFDPENPVGVAREAQKRGYDRISTMILDNERPGLLNWALEGLIRLRQRGHFEQTEEMSEAMHEVRLESNIVAGMLEDMVTYDPDCMVATANFHAAFATWWRENKGEKVPTPDSVGRALRLDDKVGVDKKELRYHHRRYYAGVRLNPDGLVAFETYARIGGLDLAIDASSEQVNVDIPPELTVKDVIKRIRKAHR